MDVLDVTAELQQMKCQYRQLLTQENNHAKSVGRVDKMQFQEDTTFDERITIISSRLDHEANDYTKEMKDFEAITQGFQSQIVSLKNQITIRDNLLTLSSQRYSELEKTYQLQVRDNYSSKSSKFKELEETTQKYNAISYYSKEFPLLCEQLSKDIHGVRAMIDELKILMMTRNSLSSGTCFDSST